MALASEGKLYLIEAMAAATGAFVSFIPFAADRHRLAIGVTAVGTLDLFVAKVIGPT